MSPDLIIPFSEENKLSTLDRIEYYTKLRQYCEVLSNKKSKRMSIGQNLMSACYLNDFYEKKLIVIGEENLPSASNILFMCNHSNSHDIFSMYIALAKLGMPTSVMVATDCLNVMSQFVFSLADATFIDRRIKKSANNGIIDLSSKLIAGKTGVIFGEATWNLHPTKAMQPLKIGGVKIAAISNAIVIPTILEYVEYPTICNKEIDLYDKIILKFGTPYNVSTDNMVQQITYIQNYMEKMRQQIWYENGINKTSLSKVDKDIYLNHTYLKKFKAFGFKYNSLNEAQFLYNKSGNVENEYYINENGEFVPRLFLKR